MIKLIAILYFSKNLVVGVSYWKPYA